MYNNFKIILTAAEAIGEIEAAELSNYKSGWIEVKGKTNGGDPFTLRLVVEAETNGD